MEFSARFIVYTIMSMYTVIFVLLKMTVKYDPTKCIIGLLKYLLRSHQHIMYTLYAGVS